MLLYGIIRNVTVTFLPHPDHKCEYERFERRVQDEGTMLEKHKGKSYEEAKLICDNIHDCGSFSFNPDNGNCFFFDKQLFGDEEEVNSDGIFTSYKNCSKLSTKKLNSGFHC